LKNKTIIFRIIFTALLAFLFFYVTLPPINITSMDFWFYLLFVVIIYFGSGIINVINFNNVFTNINIKKSMVKTALVPSIIFGIFALIFVLNFILSPVFRSDAYSKRISINEDSDFTTDVKEVDFNALPLLDKESSQKLGDRVMGQMPELVSQFYVSSLYTQINYNDKIVRVTPLEYDGFFKFFTNRKDGVKGYITVDSVSGESELIKLEKGMKYMPSAMFSKDLYRHLRFNYPTEIFDVECFEIDNEGNPYWIIPTVKYDGVGIKKEITGIIILDPITGKSKKYKTEDVPTWVDHVYSAELLIEQVDDWGKYKNGFLNSIFGQKNVVQTTDGYNYTVMNDDVYMYTGITSAAADEANLGFILSNMRTKETVFYKVPGAEEYSAMRSAEGQVQQMNYTASFPLLINLNNRATYLLSLKDNAGLVKMYAFVDVKDYQKVVVTDASKGIEVAANNYLNNSEDLVDKNNIIEKEIIIKNITSAVIDGNTYYYITDNNNQKYRISIKVDKKQVPFLSTNQTIKVKYSSESDVIEIIDLSE